MAAAHWSRLRVIAGTSYMSFLVEMERLMLLLLCECVCHAIVATTVRPLLRTLLCTPQLALFFVSFPVSAIIAGNLLTICHHSISHSYHHITYHNLSCAIFDHVVNKWLLVYCYIQSSAMHLQDPSSPYLLDQTLYIIYGIIVI
jgi:hypothetical protein